MPASSVQSRKAKGRNFQNDLVTRLRTTFPSCDAEGIRGCPASCGGEDILMSDEWRSRFPFSIEAKRCERLSLAKAFEQARRNAKGHRPMVVWKQNRAKALCIVEFDDILHLLKPRDACDAASQTAPLPPSDADRAIAARLRRIADDFDPLDDHESGSK